MTDPLEGSGLAIIDKPAGMTSHDVVARLRRIFGTRKTGHAGTLDPMATGVLVVGVNRGTKFLAHLVAETKTYEATIRLGASTTTDDKEGEMISCAGAAGISEDEIYTAVESLTGTIMQQPSAVSAIKIDGKRAHERVRAGEDVSIPPRQVTVFSFTIHSIELVAGTVPYCDVTVTVHCSSGTYIRALARDLGRKLGCGGHLTTLRRSTVGPFDLSMAKTLEELAEQPVLSLGMDEALTTCYPVLHVTEKEGLDLAMGKWLEPRQLTGIHAAVTPDGRAVALVKEKGARLSTIFVARPSTLT